MTFSRLYLYETQQVIENLDYDKIEQAIVFLAELRKTSGKLFIIGLGGSSSNASHACNDFRKITGIETYCLTDNVAELTANINDSGFENCFVNLLKTSRLSDKDIVIFLSVGGGSVEKNISMPIVKAVDYVNKIGATIISILGRDGGYVAKNTRYSIIIPPMYEEFITPHSESLQSVILHLMVSHPLLKTNETKWESLNETKN